MFYSFLRLQNEPSCGKEAAGYPKISPPLIGGDEGEGESPPVRTGTKRPWASHREFSS